jgi:hypothetical protein
MPPRGKEREDLKRANPGGHQWSAFWVPFSLENLLLFFHLLFPQQIFAKLSKISHLFNSLSGREKEPIPLDGSIFGGFVQDIESHPPAPRTTDSRSEYTRPN